MQHMYNIKDYIVKLDSLGKIIIYLRKSREDLIDGRYASDEETLSRHEEQLQQWAVSNLGHKIPDDCIYKEVESGEKIRNRPVFQQVLRAIESKDVGGILVVNCSRLSRGDLSDCGVIIKTLEVTNTVVLTPPKIYNLKDKYDKRFFKDELLRGNDYLEQTKELLANGRHWSTSLGKYTASKAPFGYDKVTCAEMKVSDEKGYTLRPNQDAKYVKMVFEMYLNGDGAYKIATHMKNIGAPLVKEKEWDHCIVKRLLRLHTYSGVVTWGYNARQEEMIDGEIIEKRRTNPACPIYKGLHEAIISPEDFERAQNRLSKNAPPVKHGFETQNPLVGLCRCAVCDKAIVRRPSVAKHPRRKYPLDRVALHDFINSHRKKLGLTGAETVRRIGGLSKHYAQDWFGSKNDKFFAADKFVGNWHKIKEVLNIESNEYDDAVLTFEESTCGSSLYCSGHNCSNKSAMLKQIEVALLEKIHHRFDDYRYYLDNYAEEIIVSAKSSRDAVAALQKKLEQKERQLKNAKIAYEKEIDSLEEYIDRKKEIAVEIKEINDQISSHNETSEEEKTIKIKKAVPILKNVFDSYFDLSATEKNNILKTIIESISFHNYIDDNDQPCIDLDICWMV